MLSNKGQFGEKRWRVTEDQILMQSELRKLCRTVRSEKDRAIAAGRTTVVKDWFVVILGLETGLRVQEMSDLSCGDLMLSAGRSSVKVHSGKGGKQRVVYARNEFASAAREYLEWKKAIGADTTHNAPVFSVKGRRMKKRALQHSYERSLKKAGIVQRKYVGIHSMRHCFATYSLVAGVDADVLQEQMGHEDINTTKAYLHLVTLRLHQGMKKLYAGIF